MPTGVERTLGEDELIVSKTDPKGILTYVNDVFLRMSAYTEDEVLGQPHNMIRHPDMPRCVFKLLWDTIKSGQEIFAYVVNLGGDGAHYWVLAHVTPSFGPAGQIVGYHSNRRSPDRLAMDIIRPLYGELVAEERRHSRPAEAMAASTAMLHERADAAGGYERFVWSLESTKVGGR
ncbi:PAS domain-containing protein [Cryptosporangium aurantiacum]|uniref:PAS domain S-box-containing protein n=1 Tax=Cryptosporangium aurantiacum TaxID=134849 RepID=A0A1M7R954_9ACTN|nr:PAS domain-containing protein [Cryptosporangium aurantiacum]SHN42558.1 PAS domain S-box-containing protein [Cryptosporangium aurantiacum]